MDTRKMIITTATMLVLGVSTFSIGAGYASADQDRTGVRLYDPIDSCSGYTEDGDTFRDCPIGAFAVPGAPAAGQVKLFGAGCPKAFTDFSGKSWCLFDVSPDNGSINTCSYNNC